jgi:RNA polymerase sigma-70 factor, ECF subfamily
LHDVEGYQHHEIAEMLGCTVGNTKSQLHKARLAIRRYLRGEAMRQRGRRRAAA